MKYVDKWHFIQMDRDYLEQIWTTHLISHPEDVTAISPTSMPRDKLLALVKKQYPELVPTSLQEEPRKSCVKIPLDETVVKLAPAQKIDPEDQKSMEVTWKQHLLLHPEDKVIDISKLTPTEIEGLIAQRYLLPKEKPISSLPLPCEGLIPSHIKKAHLLPTLEAAKAQDFDLARLELAKIASRHEMMWLSGFKMAGVSFKHALLHRLSEARELATALLNA